MDAGTKGVNSLCEATVVPSDRSIILTETDSDGMPFLFKNSFTASSPGGIPHTDSAPIKKIKQDKKDLFAIIVFDLNCKDNEYKLSKCLGQWFLIKEKMVS